MEGTCALDAGEILIPGISVSLSRIIEKNAFISIQLKSKTSLWTFHIVKFLTFLSDLSHLVCNDKEIQSAFEHGPDQTEFYRRAFKKPVFIKVEKNKIKKQNSVNKCDVKFLSIATPDVELLSLNSKAKLFPMRVADGSLLRDKMLMRFARTHK
jgi:hypothetical protein